MISKIPIIGSALNYQDLLSAFRQANNKSILDEFRIKLFSFIPSRHIYLTNSGISSFYIILKALKEKSAKKEVILPAYTAGSLVVAVVKAGLKPVLCDISLEDFNLDRDVLLKVISQDTLAVVYVHMFGIGIGDIEQLRKRIPPDIFLIEDCAQSMGTRIKDKPTGSFGDISFFSFNRGKNLPLCSGGCIATNNEEIAVAIEKNIKGLKVAPDFSLPFKILAFSLTAHPYIYGLGYFFISHFKETRPPKDFTVKKFTAFQASLGLTLLKKAEKLFSRRYQNGILLLNALKAIPGIILPKISENTYPVFNRFPVLFKDLKKKENVEKRLWKDGIETSRMYLAPLHQMFDLGYKKQDFPNANYFAKHLLTFPVHPLVQKEDLLKIIKVIT